MEVGRHRGMMANEYIAVDSYLYEKVKTFKYLGSLLANQNSIHEEIKCRQKKELHVIIQSKYICLFDFSLRI